MKKNPFAIIVGLVIIAVGVIYAGNIIGFWELDITFAGWWTLFIIIPCGFSIFSGGLNVVNSVGVAIGVLLFLSAQGILKDGIGYKLIAPIIIVAIGFGVVFKHLGRSKKDGTNGIFAGNNGENFFAIFGGNSPQFTGVVFRGANTYAVFGGIELRLQNAVIKRDCAINAYSIFGGTDIMLPDNVRAVISSTPIFGGVDNTFVSATYEGAPTVYIRAISIFGGTEIK